MATIDELKWASLTAAVNEMQAPNKFLQRLLYDRHEPKETEDIELSTVLAGRDAAPFVRKNGEAILVSGTTRQFATISPPNIRIKQPFTASQYLFTRQPGTPIFLPPGKSQAGEVRLAIGRDLMHMENMITNSIEWLVALSLQGVISYSVEDQEVFQITIPRAAANDITLSTFWDDATPADTRPLANIHTVKRILSSIPGSEGLAVTDAICGTEAAAALLELVEAGAVKMLGQAGLQVLAGQMTFVSKFDKDGVIFLGMLGGVRFWEYGRTTNLDGTAINMIRPKYVEFISADNVSSDRVMYYGAIADMTAFLSGKFKGRRFAKSWMKEDPSVLLALVTSRPLPWPRKPNATVSMKVVSG
jgi:hypothetical protein